jgi:hypothetical protein
LRGAKTREKRERESKMSNGEMCSGWIGSDVGVESEGGGGGRRGAMARTVSVQISRLLGSGGDGRARGGDEHGMSRVRTRGVNAHVVESKEVVCAERADDAHW